MRQRTAMGLFISLWGAFGMLAGCSSQAPQSKGSTPEVYDFRSEGSFPPVPEVSARPTSPVPHRPIVAPEEAPSSPNIVEDTGAAVPAQIQRPPQVWSVQVFAGRSKEVALRVAHQLQQIVPEMVYLDYIEPYYKVRVGDCEQRDECDTLRRRLLELGSESAWIVPRAIHSAHQP